MTPRGTGAPLVSILVPAWNGAAHIETTVRSLLAQTWPTLEIVVADDGSTDGTPEVVPAVAGDDPRVRLHAYGPDQNAGASGNPVRLLRLAQSNLVKFCMHDDVLAPTCVERLVVPLLADPGLALSFSKRGLIDGDGVRLPDVAATVAVNDREGRIPGRVLGDSVLESGCNRIGELTSVLFRRDRVDVDRLFAFPGGRRQRENTDIALWLKLLAAGDAWWVPEELSWFRVHGDQRSARPDTIIDGTRDWPYLIAGARSLGYLRNPQQERAALASAQRAAGHVYPQVMDHPRASVVLDALALTNHRLRELASGQDAAAPVAVGVHVPDRDRFDAEVAPALASLADPDAPIAEWDGDEDLVHVYREVLTAFDGSAAAVVLLPGDATAEDLHAVEPVGQVREWLARGAPGGVVGLHPSDPRWLAAVPGPGAVTQVGDLLRNADAPTIRVA